MNRIGVQVSQLIYGCLTAISTSHSGFIVGIRVACRETGEVELEHDLCCRQATIYMKIFLSTHISDRKHFPNILHFCFPSIFYQIIFYRLCTLYM